MKVDVSAYLVLGRENTNGRPVENVVEDAVRAGFTTIQIRSKKESVLEMIEDCRKSAEVIARLGKSETVSLLVNDRLDVILAAREQGIKVDGIHVGQNDIPVSVCRKYLGKDSVVGLTAPKKNLIEYLKSCDASEISYFGVGPVHETSTKTDCEKDEKGNVITKSFEELCEAAKMSPIPVVVGGGVKFEDLNFLKKTKLDGFFVVSAVASASNPYEAALKLVEEWNS